MAQPKLPFVRNAYNYDRDAASNEAGLDFTNEETLTQQQFAEECDINTIVRRFGLTGEMPTDLRMPVSGDFTGISDFQTAMNVVTSAQEEFMRMPAELRYRFNNDPARILQFLNDATNKDEAIKLGLLPEPPEQPREPEPIKVRVIPDKP
ncbi:MAG: internal scaffolding protein [Microvirus sp.]|nr:MAG: internal scaffolding protein [Microvirus sp.]